MVPWTLLLSAAGLLLSPLQASGKACTLFQHQSQQDSDLITSQACKYQVVPESSQIRVKIQVTLSKPMIGWQLSLQPTRPGREPFKVSNVSIGQVINQSNTNVVFLDRSDAVEEGQTVRLQFDVFSSTKDTPLFPATLSFSQPIPSSSGPGMCAGNDIPTPSYLSSRISAERRKVTLIFNHIEEYSPWIYCKLSFTVPGRILAIHNAEIINLKQLLIARNRENNTKRRTQIDYEILGNTKVGDVYNISSTLCRSCHVDKHPIPPTRTPVPPPTETPMVSTATATSALPTTTWYVTTTGSESRSTAHPTSTTSGNSYSSKSTIQTTLSTTGTQPIPTITGAPAQNKPPKSEPSADTSTNASAVWIGVAAATAGALLVLLIVVAVWITSHRRSTTATQSQEVIPHGPSTANAYVTSSTTGLPLVTHQSNGHFPCVSYSSDGYLKNGSLQYQYDDPDMYRTQGHSDFTKIGMYDNVGSYDPRLGDMLPGQRLQYLDRLGQQNGTVESNYQGLIHPDDQFTELEYVAMHTEMTYVEMASPIVETAEDNQQQDMQNATHQDNTDNEHGLEEEIQHEQDNEEDLVEQIVS